MNGKIFLGKRVSSFERFNPEAPVTGVRLLLDDENGFESGNMDGNVWEMENPYATQAMADDILEALKGQTYTGFEAASAPLGPEAELGDGVTVNGLYSVLAYQNLTFGPGHMSDIAAPGDDEPEEEYKYVPPKQREEARKLGKTRSLITKTADEIRQEISNEVEGLSSSFDVKLGEISGKLRDDINGLSSDFSIRFDGLETSFRDDQEKQSAAFDVKLDGLSATFEDELSGVTSEFTTGLSGLSSRIEGVEKKATEDLAAYEEAVNKSLGELQKQIDGAIETWFFDYEPTNDNYPASEWTDEVTKQKHLKDLFYVVENEEKGGHAYRWVLVGNTYKWQLVEDVDVTKALAAAARAQDTADHKRRNFTEQPKPPYDVGDFWSQGPSGDLMRCKTARSGGDYVESDWEKASDYTDDSYAEQIYTEITETLGKISLSVENATLGNKASITLSVNGNESTGEVDLSGVRSAFANDTSSVEIQGGTVTFSAGTFVVNSTNFSVDKSGKMTAKSGMVGGFTIDADSIFSGFTKNSYNTGSLRLSTVDFSREINGIVRSDLRFSVGANLGVGSDGTLYANNGKFSGDIYGAIYHDDKETVDLTLFPVDLGEIQSAGLKLETSEKDEIFSVTPTFAYDYNTSGFRYSGANLVLGTVHAISGKIDTDGKKIIDIGFATSVDDLDIYVKNINFARTGTTVDLSRATLNGNVEEFYSGTLSSGSTSWAKALAAHNLYLVVGKPSSGSSYVSTLIPKQSLSNRFQLSDDSYYLTFTLTETNITINSNPSGGSITGVYGIK